MFLGSLPAALGLLTDSIKLPGGFLALVVGYLAIVLGLGPIIKALRTDENSLSGIIDRALRKEIAFGSTLMFFGILFATCLISFVPGPWERVALITFLPATLGILLLSSGSIRKSVNGILGNESPKPISSISTSSTETLGPAETLEPLSLSMGTGAATADLEPPSVTENTTQLLRKRGAE